METVEVVFMGKPMYVVSDIDTGVPVHTLSQWLWEGVPKSGDKEECDAYIKRNIH